MLMRRRLCSPGVFAIIEITLLPSLQWCHCCHQAGVVALIMMALLPSSMHRRLCNCHDGVVALVALAPLPTLHRHCCPCCAGIVVPIALTSFPSCYMGVITVIVSALMPLSSWHVSTVALVPLLLSCWSYCPQCAGISAHITQASLPSLCLHRAVHL